MSQELFCVLRDAGKPLTLDEFYEEFTKRRPYRRSAFSAKVSLAYKRGYICRYARSIYYVPQLTGRDDANRT